ncbi:MAG TPA: AmmeMemoRadiSam system protein B [Terriglobia bacterium]|nr:AmmeMemoRadiSam system protein B [Terriglobia bacterium]
MSDSVPALRRGIDILPSPIAESPGLILRDPFRYTQAVLLVPKGWIPALALLNGTSTELELQATLTRSSGGQIVSREDIQQFIHTLRNHGFLDSEEFYRLRDARHEEFRNALERPPVHAGLGYPADAGELSRQLREEFRIVPPVVMPSPRILGVAAPHVSPFGGVQSYAAAYERLAPQLRNRTFVILGTSHYGAPEKFGLTRKMYRTPLGNAEVDTDLMERLASSAGEAVIREDYCHAVEHSIEFQVIFLQQAIDPNIRILPILCGPLWESLRTGEPPDSNPHVARFIDALADLASTEGEKLFWVLGVDMAHIGARYGDGIAVTANEGRMREVAALDSARLERVCAGDTRGFAALVQPNQDELKWCGYSPFYVFLRTMEHVRPKLQGRVLRYDQWNIDAQSVVSFGALEFLDGALPV